MTRYYLVLYECEDIETGEHLMEGELLTHAQRFAKAPNVSDDAFEEVYMHKSNTTLRYGSRFRKVGEEIIPDEI